jgi:hypothetical protein
VKHLLPEASGPLPLKGTEPAFDSRLVLLDVAKLIELDAAKSARPLPASWNVTTDSIAARAAVLLRADELVLLKSTLPSRKIPLRELSDTGYLDSHFPVCAKSVAYIRVVNLRNDDFAEYQYSPPAPRR